MAKQIISVQNGASKANGKSNDSQSIRGSATAASLLAGIRRLQRGKPEFNRDRWHIQDQLLARPD